MTKLRAVCVAVALAACAREAPPSPTPIATVNAVVGDASFIEAFGRLPTPGDSADVRTRTHVAYAEVQLRARDTSQVLGYVPW